MKAMVTGGAGFIGSCISRELINREIETVILDDFSTGHKHNIPEGARLIHGSITDPRALDAATDGVDIVFHFAARVSTRESQLYFYQDASTNIMGTLNVLSCCRDKGVRRIIYSSSAAVYTDGSQAGAVSESSPTAPRTPYGISKLAGEMYIREMCALFGLEHVILRHFNVYGPGQTPGPYAGVISKFVKNILIGEPPVIFGDGEQVRDFIFVEDVVRANMLAMETSSTNHVINIATGMPTSINSLARIILDVMGSDLGPVYGEAVEGDIRYSLAGVARAREVLGFEAEGRIEEKIEAVVSWLKSQ